MNAAKTKPNAKRNERRAVVSAQQTIPYVAMHPDGICQLPGGLYTKTVEYEDINYAVASTEDQTAIFGGWSSFLNYFDSSLPFQLSFVNRRSRSANRYKVNIPEQEDEFNSIRHEYAQPLTDREMRDYELRPARENLDIRRQMDAQAQVVGKWEDAHHVPEQRRLTWFYPDFGSYVSKEYVTPEQLAARAHGVERQAAAKAHKEDKQPIAQQMKTAQKQAEEHRGQTAPKKSAPRRDER